MKIIKGYFHFLQPYISARIKDNKLEFGKGPLKIKLDTGFDGALCIPRSYKKQIAHKFSGRIIVYDYKMKSRNEKLYETKIHLGNKQYDFDFIMGDFLIGMEFMKEVFQSVSIDFTKNKINIYLK